MSEATIKLELTEEQCNALRFLAEALSICANAFGKEAPVAEVEKPGADELFSETNAIRVYNNGLIEVRDHTFLAGVAVVRYEGAQLGYFDPGKWVVYCYDEEFKGGKQKWRTCKQGEKALPLGIYIAGIVDVPQR